MTKTLIQLAQEEHLRNNKIVAAAKVNGKLEELTDSIPDNGQIEMVTTETKIGIETYRRSVLMLMLSAVHNMFPSDKKIKVSVEFSVSKGLFCDIKSDFKVTASARMS